MKEKNLVSIFLDPIMAGVNYMLPCIVAGGLLMGLSFLVDDPSLVMENFGSNTPFASFLNTVGTTMFGFMLPVLTAGIAYSIAGVAAIPAGLMAGAIVKEGTSGFLGALVIGFVVGFLIVILEKLLKKMPESLEGLKNLLMIPLFSVFFTGAITLFLVEPVVGTLNTGLNSILESMNGSSLILLGAILGAMQSVDFGGPINKTAYLFATASLANGDYVLMSAVLAGAIVSPYVTALSSTIFKSKFSAKERTQGFTNYLIGLAGISECAIPYAVKDPVRVIGSCVIGSAVAGGLSVYFGCRVMAPFGGVFIIPLNDSPLGFIAAMCAGILVGTLLLGFSKKPIQEETPVEKTSMVDSL